MDRRRAEGPANARRAAEMFSSFHYPALLDRACRIAGLALAGQGHKVTLGYLPYANWQKPINLFDLRRQTYARKVLEQTQPFSRSSLLI